MSQILGFELGIVYDTGVIYDHDIFGSGFGLQMELFCRDMTYLQARTPPPRNLVMSAM